MSGIFGILNSMERESFIYLNRIQQLFISEILIKEKRMASLKLLRRKEIKKKRFINFLRITNLLNNFNQKRRCMIFLII